MAPHVRSPVQIQTAVAVPDGLHYQGSQSGGGSSGAGLLRSACDLQMGRRRIFVQIDTGNVLGLELDRTDKADIVKKKVQAALCVPTEQCALVFNDQILEKDLSDVRQDSPLLLQRNLLQRSCSTPCLSPTLRDLKEQLQQPTFEIMGGQNCSSALKRLVRETARAIDAGVQPQPASGGLGGAYYFGNRKGENVALVKPTDEEPFAPNNPKGFVGRTLGQPGLKRSIRVGETAVREVAAYLLDHDHFANVPSTALVKATHPIFNVNSDASSLMLAEGCNPWLPVSKICSFQQFVKHDFDAGEQGTSRFPTEQVHRIGILDIRILNTDRHAGNILIRKETEAGAGIQWEMSLGRESVSLIPIDHGLCLPEMLEDPYFEWLHWPQASRPFSADELLYIENLDPFKDAEMLRRALPMLRETSLRILVICTIFLKRGAAAGLTLAEIGGMMGRELCGLEEGASGLESLCMLAKLEMEQDDTWQMESYDTVPSEGDEPGDQDQFQFDLDINPGHSHDDEFAWDSVDGRSLRSPLSGSSSVFQTAAFRPSTGHYSSEFGHGWSPVSSPRVGTGCRGGLPSLVMVHEMQPVEEDSDCPPSPYTPTATMSRWAMPPPQSPNPPTQEEKEKKSLTSSGSFHEGAFMSGFLGPFRSISLSSQKRRSRKQYEARSIGLGGTSSVWEIAQKISEAGGDVNTPVVLSDMTEKEWVTFLEIFEDLLPDAFEARKVESAKSLQRLGNSCRF